MLWNSASHHHTLAAYLVKRVDQAVKHVELIKVAAECLCCNEPHTESRRPRAPVIPLHSNPLGVALESCNKAATMWPHLSSCQPPSPPPSHPPPLFFLINTRCCLWWLLNKERAVFSCNLSAPESGTWHMSGCDKWCRVPVISPGMPLRCPKPQSQMLLLN